MTQKDSKTYKVVSLFAGSGGFDYGFEGTGRFDVIACLEKVPAFCETLRRNRDTGKTGSPQMKVYEGDISRADPLDILADLGLRPGEIDVVIGGPPCQTFSTTGKRETVQDPRGTLLWEFLRFVEAMQPKIFVMENVRGLMSAALRHRPIADRPDKGGFVLASDEQPGSVLRRFLLDLQDRYRMDCFEVNAVNYGAPQLRERVLFIGNRFNRQAEFPAPTHGESTQNHVFNDTLSLFSDEPDRQLLPFRTLGDALDGLEDITPIIMDFSPRKKKYLSLVPPGGNWRCLPAEVAQEAMGGAYFAKGGRSGWWRRLSLDLPCPAILTMPNHAGTALCHPTEVRALTLRECARVQEFPDDWIFCGKPTEQYAQVGNAVPIRLASVCARKVADELDGIYESGFKVEEGERLPFRVVYLSSHVRTRRWFKAGQKFVWQDGEENNAIGYGPGKTRRKVSVLK